MKLSGEVVAVKKADFKNDGGETIEFFRIYLKSADPIGGALEIAVSLEQFDLVKLGDKVSFQPSFSARANRTSATVIIRVYDQFVVSA